MDANTAAGAVISTALNFLREHEPILAALTALGAGLFLAEETIYPPKQRLWSPLRIGFIFALLTILVVALNVAMHLPLVFEPQNLVDKTYLVTGCTQGGIGYETARTLLKWNASTVVCTMRSAEKAESLKASMVGVGPGRFDVVVMELTSFASVRSAAKEIISSYKSFDGVLLNAGLMTPETHITEDGFNEMYQVNHLSQYLLLRLIENLLHSGSRVEFVSSSSYVFLATLDRDIYGTKPGGRFFLSDSYSQLAVYTDTKLMNILSANAFARKLASKGVKLNSFCPGLVATGFQSKIAEDFTTIFIIRPSVKIAGRTPIEGATRGLYLLTSPTHNETTGRYFDPYIRLPMLLQVNKDNEDWLYETSAKLVGLSP